MEKLKNKNVNLTNIIEGTKEILTEIDNSNGEDIELEDNTHYIEEYKQQTKEMEDSDKVRFYTFPSHPVLKENLRIQKGWYGSLTSTSAGGKSVVSAMLAIDFAKTYREKVIYATDENLKSTIIEYMHSHYFNISISDIQTRKIKLDEYINNLTKEQKKEYQEIFKLITVWELVGLPTDKIKRHIKSEGDIGLLVLDSHEEVDSLTYSGIEETARYDLGAKKCEAMTKELGIITLATAQMATQYYNVCASKLPLLCNFNSRQLIKKNFFSLVLHSTFDDNGNKIDDVMKINKNRSGAGGIMYGVEKKYSHMQLIPEGKEYDLSRIKNKDMEKLDF